MVPYQPFFGAPACGVFTSDVARFHPAVITKLIVVTDLPSLAIAERTGMVACRMTLLCASLLGASAWMLAAPGAPARQTGASRLPLAPQMNSDGLSAEFQARTAPYGMIRAFPTHWSAPAPWVAAARVLSQRQMHPCALHAMLPRLGQPTPSPTQPSRQPTAPCCRRGRRGW